MLKPEPPARDGERASYERAATLDERDDMRVVVSRRVSRAFARAEITHPFTPRRSSYTSSRIPADVRADALDLGALGLRKRGDLVEDVLESVAGVDAELAEFGLGVWLGSKLT